MQQIIAIGGGTSAPDLLLERYVLEQAGKPNPRICVILTASGDANEYLDIFHSTFGSLPCELTHLPLFSRTPIDLRDFIFTNDVIFVGGGNTKSLIAVWRDWGLNEILRDAWQQGIVLAGVSAGANCWFESCVTDSWEKELRAIPCLGFLSGSFCPHYDGEADRRPSYHHMVGEGQILPGLAADDGCAIHFTGTHIHSVVSSRAHASAYQLTRTGTGVSETPLPTKHLR